MTEVSFEKLEHLFDLDIETGVLRWKERPISDFPNIVSWQRWHIRTKGRVAGNKRPDGYIRVTIDKKRHYAHRIVYAMANKIDLDDVGQFVDHIDMDCTNNAPCNLRIATKSQNTMNTTTRADSESGIKGVGWDKHRGAWCVRVKKDGKVFYRGLFASLEDAYLARQVAANDAHGKFARAV